MDLSDDIGEHETLPALAGSTLSFAVGFFLSFRAIIPVLWVRGLGTDPQAGAEAKLALNFIVLGFVCFALLGAGGRTLASMLHSSSIRWVFIYLGFSGCSLLWSATASLPAS